MDEAKENKLQKLMKKVEETFVDSVRAASNEKLRDEIIKLTGEIDEQMESKKNNTVLAEHRANAKALADGYNNVIKDRKDRISLIMLLLESRGNL